MVSSRMGHPQLQPLPPPTSMTATPVLELPLPSRLISRISALNGPVPRHLRLPRLITRLRTRLHRVLLTLLVCGRSVATSPCLHSTRPTPRRRLLLRHPVVLLLLAVAAAPRPPHRQAPVLRQLLLPRLAWLAPAERLLAWAPVSLPSCSDSFGGCNRKGIVSGLIAWSLFDSGGMVFYGN